MKYVDSITDFFRSPKWVTNLLLGAVCVLIPIVGPMVLIGWHSVAHFARRDPVDYVNYPEFNFDHFGKHLERGVWPFLVYLAANFVMVPVIWVLMFAPMALSAVAIIPMAESGDQEPPVWVFATIGGVMLLGYLVALAVFMLVINPLSIRAAITQDFAAAFNFNFLKDFTARTWIQQLAGGLFIALASIVLMVVGMLFFCVGMYVSMSLIAFAAWHQQRQYYDLYLERGGEPVPVSPKISGVPPPLVLG